MAVKERRIKCARCGERDTVTRGERGPVTIYCDLCRDEVRREQACERMRQMRERRGLEARQFGLDGELYPHQNPV